MIKGKTISGFSFKIEDSALNDWELLEIFDELEDEPQRIVQVAKKLLGETQYKALKDHCRDENGKVALDKMSAEIKSILRTNSLKN